ncbi:cyclase family protein [Jannaschia sp. CCS1]|uniref:cyclase family protein n=1 Tax=Jannaschia sp. (strain CCS1) TaxID=290400 RepID=UPI000053A2A9|nr:cyclase family protein [Jannaschia sp. CCS1]ABD54955.1 putative cyclase [Jannaschia sp. CCS1]
MPRRFIDISVALEAGIASDPPIMLPQIDYFTHAQTAGQVASFFPGLTEADLPGGEGWAVETLTVSTHNGTHLDAPYHHHSTMDGGKPSATIDEVPLEWCLRPGVKLDFRHLPDGYIVQAEEVEAELIRIGHNLQPLDIVVINTSAGARYGQEDYLNSGCGMGREATLWLLDRGVRVTGTDAWSWDAPFAHTAKRWEQDRDPSIIWEGHRASMTTGYCHMEKLSNLETLPATGFTISCFPIKIKRASAGFTRAVAILEDET